MFAGINFENFNPKKTTWDRYQQQLKFFLIANKVKDNLQLPTILSLIGSETFNLLCDLLAPETPDTKTTDQIFQVLSNHFSPKLIARSERFKLRSRKQKETESITDFVAALRKLSINCAYKEDLDIHLADQFVYGLSSQTIQKRLLTEDDSTSFAKLIQIATVTEATLNDAAQIFHSDKNTEDIFKIKNSHKFVKPAMNNCQHCGERHNPLSCKFKDALCYYCKKKGHIIAICRARNKIAQKNITYKINETGNEIDSTELQNFSIQQIEDRGIPPIFLNIKINNSNIIKFELDTGAGVSVLPLYLYNKFLKEVKLKKTNIKLSAFGNIIFPIGKISVDIFHNNKSAYNQELFIIKDCSTPLLGRTWIKSLDILGDINIRNIDISELNFDKLLKTHEKLFAPELGLIKNFRVHIELKDGATPKFCKHRPVPFALLPKIETELDKLIKQKILEPIKYSDWAAPIVPILKKDNSLRICADYKVGLNPCLKVNQYPLPVIDEILSKLTHGKIFSKLDMSQAYQQVLVDDTSAQYLSINTHKGLFAVKRLPFGIASAPAVFQQLMDKILVGLPNTSCYLDDILIASPDESTHLHDLKLLFQRLEETGIRLNKNKCEFRRSELEYLGHIINAAGIQPATTKIDAILNAPEPQNVDQLRSLLGMVSYYRKFLPNLATTLAPLHRLLCKDIKWTWNTEASIAFQEIKKAITSPKLLTHYDPDLPIIVAADASPTGLGAVISHLGKDGLEHPVAFASRSLTKPERNYSQIDKEALSLIFAIKKFHKFIFGRSFTLVTDHKPLTHILDSGKPIPILAAARLQRWALTLAAYDYKIKYRPSKQNNADALSRLPCPDQTPSHSESDDSTFLIGQIDEFPWTYQEIAIESKVDNTLSKVLQYTKSGWPRKDTTPQELKPYYSKREEISILENCLLWGDRVIIPVNLRPHLLEELHRHHVGIVRMKMLARSLFWWPDIDKDIENTSHNCQSCALFAKDPPKTPVHHWIRPQAPWERVHLDFAGPIAGHTFLVVVDAYSKWPEVVSMTSTDTIHTAKVLENYFVRYGYPVHLVTDNGAQFTSTAFATFCQNRGIHHTLSPPFHPASNGQAERFVQVLKIFLHKLQDYTNLAVQVNDLLFTYRSTPLTSTGKSPAELFLGRKLRNRLQLTKPPTRNTTWTAEVDPSKIKNYQVGDKVLSKTFSNNKLHPRWERGEIIRKYGPVTYLVKLPGERIGKRHADQLRPSHLIPEEPEAETPHTSPPPARTPAVPRYPPRCRRQPANFQANP